MLLQRSFTFHVGIAPKHIELLVGDLTRMSPHDPVDVLVVSAFPGDYLPTPGSLVGALARAGVDVADLARVPEYDLRTYWHSWLSRPVGGDHGFGRILCFETPAGRAPADVVDGVFRALAPFIGGEGGVQSVAMPLVATGDQGATAASMLPAQLRAAYHALRTTALHRVAIVVRDEARAAEVGPLFEAFKREHLGVVEGGRRLPSQHDVFLSYSRKNADDAALVTDALRHAKPDITIFRDLDSLRGGRDYRVQLDGALRRTRRVVALYTPEYLHSPACQDEFNTAWALYDHGHEGLLAPLFVRQRSLHGLRDVSHRLDDDRRRQILHWVDCVEAAPDKLNAACRAIAAELHS